MEEAYQAAAATTESAAADRRQSRRRTRGDDDDAVPLVYHYIPERADVPAAPSKRARLPASSKTMLGLQEVASTEYSGSGDDCAICLQDLFHVEAEDLLETKLRAMPCSHVFHQPCIFEWLRRNAICPLCRHQLPTGDEEEMPVEEEEEDRESEEDRERRMRGFTIWLNSVTTNE